LTRATMEPARCQVRSGTDRPCPRPAVVKIWDIPYCERCAREQEAYFAIGELTQEAEGLRNKSLGEALYRVRWERAGYTRAAEIERATVAIGVPG
jgi:hypothetical protein